MKKELTKSEVPFYIPNNLDAIPKYTSRLKASTIVVINGLAITAGSNFSFLANKGNVEPITLANITVITKVKQTTPAIFMLTPSINNILAKLASANVTPHKTATLISFHTIFNKSLSSISFKYNLRIIVTLAL